MWTPYRIGFFVCFLVLPLAASAETGDYLTEWGSSGSGPGQFDSPTDPMDSCWK